MTTATTTNARHVLISLGAGKKLPDDVLGELRDEVVLAGWLRAGGELEDVELRVAGGTTRKIKGPLHAVSIEGSIGLANGDVACTLRAVLARETDTGIETVAGEIVSAKVTHLEAIAMAFDDVTATAGFTSLSVSAPSSPALPQAAPPPPPPVVAAPPPPPPVVAAPPPPVVAATPPAPPAPPPPSDPAPERPRPSPTFSQSNPMPTRPVKVQKEEELEAVPDAGDIVEHFAFGRCEVVKSDGDRLHIRLGKDGRIKEVALEMLKVTPLGPVEGSAGKHWNLARRL